MRILASILFALMTFILPTAAVTRNFCTLSMDFVAESGKCHGGMENCCCDTSPNEFPQPDCMVAAKPLPNADKTPAPHLPGADLTWVLLPALLVDFPSAMSADVPLELGQRGPPVIPDPLYLTQQRLLI